MPGRIRDRILPDHKRRSLEDLQEDLDLSSGDSRAKQSAFWTMLTLSSVIAACGILTDSTATVIGAMIIAPLSTPIMGIALGAVQRRRSTALAFVALGGLLVLLIGALASLVVPTSYDLLSDSQIAGRTSPASSTWSPLWPRASPAPWHCPARTSPRSCRGSRSRSPWYRRSW